MVICPGGGYGGLAGHEGKGYADWLVKQGADCFVLKYRLGSAGYRHPVMWRDVSRAIRTVRAKAGIRLARDRIGVMGSSAGGHLTSTIVAHFDYGSKDGDAIDRVSSRPDLAVLCYPVITLGKHTHEGSVKPFGRKAFAGTGEIVVQRTSGPKGFAACFIWRTWEDGLVPMENSMLFASALRRQGVCGCRCIFARPAGTGLVWVQRITRNCIHGPTS